MGLRLFGDNGEVDSKEGVIGDDASEGDLEEGMVAKTRSLRESLSRTSASDRWVMSSGSPPILFRPLNAGILHCSLMRLTVVDDDGGQDITWVQSCGASGRRYLRQSFQSADISSYLAYRPSMHI